LFDIPYVQSSYQIDYGEVKSLIEYTDLLGTDLAGYATVTVCMYKCDACVYRERKRSELPSPAGALSEPLAM
jgi:hypothetical protein